MNEGSGSESASRVILVPSQGPDPHPAVTSDTAEACGYYEPLDNDFVPESVVVVVSNSRDATTAKALRDDGVDTLIWAWHLPEAVAADLMRDGMPVVFGWHTLNEVHDALNAQGRYNADDITTQLAELEQITELDELVGSFG